MKTNEAIGLACRVISAAVVNQGKQYWLIFLMGTLVILPEKEIPSGGIKVFCVNQRMVREGLSSSEWDMLEKNLRFVLERKT